VAHGAVTVDRIILSADGRLMIREHMVGQALDSLEWPAARLWAEFGIIVPRSSPAARIDERTDITQLGLVVLSLMAGRRIGPDDYPDRMGALLDELTLKNHLQNPSNPGKFQALRHWLERALQLSGQSFSSASEGGSGAARSPGAWRVERHAGRSGISSRAETGDRGGAGADVVGGPWSPRSGYASRGADADASRCIGAHARFATAKKSAHRSAHRSTEPFAPESPRCANASCRRGAVSPARSCASRAWCSRFS
jgi:hypothetical protein